MNQINKDFKRLFFYPFIYFWIGAFYGFFNALLLGIIGWGIIYLVFTIVEKRKVKTKQELEPSKSKTK